MTFKMNLCDKLKDLRQSKGITVYRLSQETGISQNHIRELESGKRNPSVETLRRLCDALGVNLSEMFNDSSDISYLSSDERELIEHFRKLSDEKSKLLLKIASEFCNN